MQLPHYRRNAKNRNRLNRKERRVGLSEDQQKLDLASNSEAHEATLNVVPRAYRLIQFRCQQAVGREII